ncbi:MAG: tetratricopeptide repeat protein [Rhodospirillaceae bacterium]
MELTIEQTLQQGMAAHKDGKLQDAERLYRAILQSQPQHPHANHNLGVLAVSVNKTDAALPLFRTALEANSKIEQFWLSYIDALIKEKQNEVAKQVIDQAKKQGVDGKKLHFLDARIVPLPQTENAGIKNPSQNQLNSLSEYYQTGNYVDAEKLATSITHEFPQHQFAWKVLGALLGQSGRHSEAANANQTAVALSPQDAESHNNLGVTLKELGRLDEAEASYAQAIALKPDFAEAFWNLSGCAKTIEDAEKWIDKCLKVNVNHQLARLTKAALRFYQGDRDDFDNLMQSEFKQHCYMRSFSWAFNLPNLPELHFNKWYFFDAIIKKSITSKPFYEFGVWRASSFKYLIKVFKKGYGFDTFTGLSEDWDVGNHVEKEGTYSSDGDVPKIEGGEFIVGKFEDTLPVFFSESRPTASLINFDADLYSSTICALTFSKPIIDKDTVLVFDEFIINESWEQDEFKALNEFCSINQCSYEVVAISFFTKQVAVKLIGI